MYTTWTQFDQYGSTDAACQSNIFFSISTNGGTKWSKSVQINQDPGDCSDDDDTAANSSPAVSYDGKLYAAWAKKGMIYMDRSYDGETWLSSDLAVTKQTGGWSLNIPGVGRSNGRPMLAVNVSPTRALGTLYLSYADQKNGENDTDVWFLRSVNRGDNWTSSLKIGKDESGRHQFSPAMCVDQATGYIYIVYYDRRAYDDLQTDVYLSYSIDGGNVFIDAKISEAPFTSSESKTFGGNINVSAAGGVIAAAWTRIDNGKVSVMATVIKGDDLPKK
ncbi:MAG: sialidase family protein [Bacteroidota bacterium]